MDCPTAEKLQAEVEEEQPSSLSVLTQNVWCHYPMSLLKQEQHAMRGAGFEERLALFAEYVSAQGIDVLLCQELFLAKICFHLSSHNFDMFTEAMKKAGLRHHSEPKESMRAVFAGQNSGLVIFCKWPLLNCRSFDFESTSERLNSKGFVCADVLMANNRRVHLVNAHLDARKFSMKKQQVLQISRHLQAEQEMAKANAELQPEFVVCGDWNLCPEVAGSGGWGDGSEFGFLCESLAAAGLEDLWRADESEGTHNRATLDHIFLRRAAWKDVDGSKQVVQCLNEQGLNISDHLGLRVQLHTTI
mmetsp:Transcript_81667/g.142391  ORF Transcript_81667/g.142391 Transcript_81667/m.142391 type:complete len:303 (-) Transcript_81667:166-1074(-)